MEDEMVDESPSPEEMGEPEEPTQGEVQSANDVEVSPRDRIRQYLETQMARRQAKETPEYQQLGRQDREGLANAQGSHNLTALALASAGNFNNIKGQKTSQSNFGQFADRANKNLSDHATAIKNNEMASDANQDKQMQMYDYLAKLQGMEQSEKTKQFQADTARQRLMQPDYGNTMQDPVTGAFNALDRRTGKVVQVGQGNVKPETPDLRETDRVDDQGNALIFNHKTGSYQQADGANGVKVMPKSKTPKEATADQYKAAGFSKRMEQAEDVMGRLAEGGFHRESNGASLRDMAPGFLQNESTKSQAQAERNFLNAVLRRESGAAIGKEEFLSGEQQYFPRAGDTPQVLAQKKANRQQATETMKAEGGPAYANIPTINVPVLGKKGAPGTATAAPAAKPVDQMTEEEIDAELAAHGGQ